MFQNFDADMAFAILLLARHSRHSRNPFHAGDAFRGFTGSLPLHMWCTTYVAVCGADQYVAQVPGTFLWTA